MRLFTFGCSLTQYFYPTWADIIINDFKEKYNAVGYNWGRSGAGNQYIFTKLWEADAIYNFCPEDIVIVQWTSMFREDRYHEDNGWYLPGGFSERNLNKGKFTLNSFEYEDEMQWADFLHCAMRDCSLVSSAKKALTHTGARFYFTGFRPFMEGWEEFENFDKETLLRIENIGAIISAYGNKLSLDIEPVLTALGFGTDELFFKSRPFCQPAVGEKYKSHLLRETHPLPLEHKTFVEDFVYDIIKEPCKLTETTIDFVYKYHNMIKDQDPIILNQIGWVNNYQMGFSDDGWRP
jgi:hypothetical protein